MYFVGILKVEPIALPDEINMRCEREESTSIRTFWLEQWENQSFSSLRRGRLLVDQVWT